MSRIKILFLCTGNSCRSQMAEGFAKALKSDVLEAYSAGVERHGMNPLAIRAMAEAGVDISQQHSKTVDELPTREFDFIVTLCGHANEHCPYFPGQAVRIHAGFDDPPQLAKDAATEEEALEHYKTVRDAIREYVLHMPENLKKRT
ncbi:MAG: arsenate reductase ArsC [Desulfovibrio sp.]|uniref:arsenate reductase ArsC n=1 Tax=Desulfovibrio sp. 7SRBS1 TaxID=3378064 RepID=UPI003B3E4329